MNKVLIYGHYGSQNHGNEAIVRGVSELFSQETFSLYSYTPEADIKYELDELCKVNPFFRMYKRYSPEHIFLSLWTRLTKNQRLFYIYSLKPFLEAVKGVCMLEAGDQYCENDNLKSFYAYVNKKIIQHGGKTVMLPCTISEDSLTNPNLIKDLKKYSLIFARESITYNALLNAGLSENIRFAPCPAFIMRPKECQLPKLFSSNPIVGITIGYLAQGKELYTKAVFENTRTLIRYIINCTNYAIALIPHVNVEEKLTDLLLQKELFKEFEYTGRIVQIAEQRADMQKYVLSNCKFVITIRTHVSIAAYSSGVPTLVIGYSQKSKGIAKDLFGTWENYVISVESLNEDGKLVKGFEWLRENETAIREIFKNVLPAYIEKVRVTYDEIIKIAGE